MILKIINASIFVILFSLFYAHISYADGNALLEECVHAEQFLNTKEIKNQDSALKMGRCVGLVEGVRSTLVIMGRYLEENTRTCFPKEGINNGQAIRIVVKFLKSHPEKLHENATYLSILAFKKAFSCS